MSINPSFRLTEQVRMLHLKYIETIEQHVQNIENILKSSKDWYEGNCFYKQTRNDGYLTKQANLLWSGSMCNNGSTEVNICEIGFNAGYSAMLILLGALSIPIIKLTVFDIGEHTYTKPCLEYIEKNFPSVEITYIQGDSFFTLPKFLDKNTIGIYDLIHVDGGHATKNVIADTVISSVLLKKNGLMIIDDIDQSHIRCIADLYINSGDYLTVDILPSNHVVLRKK